jgi:hypothetical protein
VDGGFRAWTPLSLNSVADPGVKFTKNLQSSAGISLIYQIMCNGLAGHEPIQKRLVFFLLRIKRELCRFTIFVQKMLFIMICACDRSLCRNLT